MAYRFSIQLAGVCSRRHRAPRRMMGLACILACLVFLASPAPCAGAAEPERAAPEATALAELPYWPAGWLVPDSLHEASRPNPRRTRRTSQAEVLLWFPDDAPVLRSALVIAQNTDSKHVGEHPELRAVAARHGMAIVYVRINLHASLVEGGEGVTPALFAFLADETGRGEFLHMPWILFGKSSMGRHPILHAWRYPERTIGGIGYHAETPPWPLPAWAEEAANHSILYLCIHGHHEWMGTWYRHVRPQLLNYRRHTRWLPHQVVIRNLGHGNYADVHGSAAFGHPTPQGVVGCRQVWDYVALAVEKMLMVRLPPDADPRRGPVTLRTIDPATGVHLHSRAPEVVTGFQQRPIREQDGVFRIVDHVQEPHEVYADEAEVVEEAVLFRTGGMNVGTDERPHLWLVDAQQLEAWQALHRPHPDDPVREPKRPTE